MRKPELAAAIAEKADLTKEKAAEVLNAVTDQIAKALGLDGAKDLNSFESLLAAIEKNLPADEVEKIKTSFAKNGTVKDVGVPSELVQKESLADKQMNRILQLSGYNRYEV
mgnify:CR=1 FL=1